MRKIAIVVLEANTARRAWLVNNLSRELDFQVLAAVYNLETLLEQHIIFQCDVLLLDIDQSCMSEACIWARIHVALPGVRIVALTEGSVDQNLERALSAGVAGLHRSDAEIPVVCRAIRNAAQGAVDFDAALLDRTRQVLLQPLIMVQVRYSELTIDLQLQRATVRDKVIHLTWLESKVLEYLAHHPGRPICAEELLEAVWVTSLDRGGTLPQVHNCVKRIRKKIEPDAKHPRYLQCVRGQGYYLQDPATVY